MMIVVGGGVNDDPIILFRHLFFAEGPKPVGGVQDIYNLATLLGALLKWRCPWRS